MSKFDIIVIGDGFAARTVLASLDKSYHVLQIFDKKRFPAASASAGALASTYGARKGLSELGDINVESFESFQNFIRNMNLPYCVQKMLYYFDPKKGSEIEQQRFTSRWGDEKIKKEEHYWCAKDHAFLIDPQSYLDDLKTKFNDSIETKRGTVVSIKDKQVTLADGDVFSAKYVIDCSGAFGDCKKHKKHKIAFGAYFKIPYDNGEQDFLLNLQGKNILYHHKQKQLVIGATTQNDGSMVADLATMWSWREGIDELFENLDLKHIDWGKAFLITGLRSKAQKRMPRFYWDEDVFSIYGLYKNGLMYSVKALEELSTKIQLDSKLQQ